MSDELNIIENNLVVVDIEKEMKSSYLDYSMSVIVSRALPDVRDGLKPVHRRILYTMHENGLTPDKAYRKSADTVGSVLARFHPHGDASVYDALVRMAQDFSLRYPLVDGHGNFGSVDGDPPAAYRYTEARMSKISLSMLTDIDKETIDYGPNYDDSRQEPLVLPSRFPNLLVNGSSGIAVGMATNIPPHNLGEVIDAVCLLIENPDASMDEIMTCIKGPDFPTGGIIMGKSGIRSAYATGHGKITLRSRTEIEEMKNGRFRIVVTEIPYMVNKARLIESIAEHVKNKVIEGISDLRDESDRDGMRIVIELKKEANAQIVLNHLFSYTQMQDTVGVNMLALVNGEPKVLSLKEMLQHYIRFQEQIIYRRTQFDLKKAQDRAHILEGLKIALDFIDEVIKILRASKSIPEGKDALMERFGLTEMQAGAIVAMRLGQLTGLERAKIEEELAALEQKIAELQAILGDEHKILEIVRNEISQLRQKFADGRRTEIQSIEGEMDIEDLIPNEACVITRTRFGYVKRQDPNTYKAQRRGGRGISGMSRRDEDFVKEMFLCNTHDYIMFFTNRGRVYRIKAYEIAESSRTARGTNLVNLLPLEAEEQVTSMIEVDAFTEDSYLVMLTKNGIVKRTELSAYKNVRKNGLIAISLDEGDELCWVMQTTGSDELIIATRLGMAIRMKESNIRCMGRGARGVRALKLAEEDAVIGMASVQENASLLTVTEKGFGRRTKVEEYRLQSRGGKGIRNYKYNENKGFVADIKMVNEEDEVILITDDGVIIRIRVSEVNNQSRYGSGVRVMRVADGSRVVTIARAGTSEEEVEVSHIEAQPDEIDESGEAEEELEIEETEETEEAEEAEKEEETKE